MAVVEFQESATGGGLTAVVVSPTAPLPVTLEGGNVTIGAVDIDQTTPGITNGVVTNQGSVTSLQIGGAANGLTNPVFEAFAEAGDTTGTLTASSQTVTATNCDGYSTALVSVHGTYTGLTLSFAASDDSGTTYYPLGGVRSDDGSIAQGSAVVSTNASQQWSFPIGGNDSMRVTATAFGSGTANIRISVSAVPTLPPGAVVVGSLASDGSTTITTGGTAQNLFSGATPNHGFAVYNPDPTNDLWVSDSTTALANGTGSIRVSANGGAYETPDNYKPFSAVSIVGAVTGQKITARQW